MADYLIGIVLAAAVVLALRSHFGKKYADSACGGCSGCSRAAQCSMRGKETVDKSAK